MTATARSQVDPSYIEELFWDSYLRLKPRSLEGLQQEFGVAREVPGRLYYIDFALPERKIGIELDSYQFHSGKDTFTRDRKRARELWSLGWTLLHFSGVEVMKDAEACVREAADSIARSRQPRSSLDKDLVAADLTRADLSGADLTEANLHLADLTGANLQYTDFGGADLMCACLDGANLWGANLNGADLSWADFTGANLLCADLRGTNLHHARLNGAKMNWATYLDGAFFGNTTMPDGTVRNG